MGKLIDLTGRRFGSLTVIERAANKNKKVHWTCKCDCGETEIVEGQLLREGHKVRCRKCTSSGGSRRLHLEGMRFGRLAVEEYVGNSCWRCKCDCGGHAIASGYSLVNGKTTSCGCYHNEKLRTVRNDRTGKRYGHLTALNRVEGQKWLCKCDCGNEVVVDGRNLTTGHTKSCGCLKEQSSREYNTTHGCSNERLYGVWRGMMRRCYKTSRKEYEHYGGRGIRVCDEWRNDYMTFREWALSVGYDPSAPKGQFTIERIDVNGDYCPENCCWISISEQSKNRRCCHPVEQLDDDGNVLCCYPTLNAAAKAVGGKSARSIGDACSGKGKTAYGYRWRYASQLTSLGEQS